MGEQYSKEVSAKLNRLYRKYRYIMQKEAYSILFDKNEVEDAVQISFMKIANHLDKVDEENEAMTCGFLKVVVRNVARDFYKKKLYLNSYDDAVNFVDDREFGAGRTTEVSEIVITKDSVAKITKAIENLPEIYRDVLLLEKVYGYTREETMHILGASYETVKKRITRAKMKLLEELKKEGLNDGRESIGRNA